MIYRYANIQFLIASTMTAVYDLVEKALADCNKHLPELLTQLKAATQTQGDLHTNSNVEYALKRFIRAACSHNAVIKENSAIALRVILDNTTEGSNIDRIVEYAMDTTSSHHAEKKSEESHYYIARLLVLNSLIPYLPEISERFKELFQGFDGEFGEQAMTTAYLMLKKHPNAHLLKEFKAFKLELSDKLKLYKRLLVLDLKNQKEDLTIAQLNGVAQIAIGDYPKQTYLVSQFIKATNWTNEKWLEVWKHLLGKYSDETTLGYKGIYFIIEVLKARSITKLSNQTLDSILSKELMDLWMNQLVVLNKRCRELSISIEFNLGVDEDAAFRFLQFLHQQNVFIGNIQKKHPLQNIYKTVNTTRFLKYLLGRIDAEFKDEELYEAYAFIRLASGEISDKLFARVIRLLVHKRNQQESTADKYDQMLWSLIAWKMSKEHENIKKDPLAKAKALLLLYKKVGVQSTTDLNEVGDYITTFIESLTETSSNKRIQFANFIATALLWSSISKQEIDTCQQFLMLAPDFIAYLDSIEGASEAPRKKKKKSAESDPKKPIHVLVDIFISYLTRAPIFLRHAIDNCFESLIEDLDDSDLLNLIAVLTRPDKQYIEQTDE